MTQLTIPEANSLLLNAGMIRVVDNRYSQVEPNCFDIAKRLVTSIGYRMLSQQELQDVVDAVDLSKNVRILEDLTNSSKANLIWRPNKSRTESHVTLEYKGLEFNYGYGDSEGFFAKMKIPLRTK